MSGTPTPEREQVAAEVRALMGRGQAQRRVSQVKLAKHLKMAQASLSRRLTGEVPFDIDELAEIARYFGVSLGSLMGAPSTALTSQERADNTIQARRAA